MLFAGKKPTLRFLPALLVLAAIIVWATINMNRSKRIPNTLRVAFPKGVSASYYDPARIEYAAEYTFLQNIYSPLVEYSVSGELVSAVAEKFRWQGANAVFHIRKNLTTIDGHTITAYDVEASFKRLFIIGGNTHGDLKNLLCPGTKLRTLDSVCEGMGVANNGNTFVLKFKERKTFLFSMLASMDFAVIPKNSIDRATMKIIDYRNTTGPYYVSRDSADGKILLSVNPGHFHWTPKIPQEVILMPSEEGDALWSINMFSSGKIDHITNKDSSDWAKISLAKGSREANLHLTYPIHLHAVVFTEKGMKRLSKTERIAIAKRLKVLFLRKYLSRPGFEETKQVIPVFGEGGLSRKQLDHIENISDSVNTSKPFTKEFICWNFFGASDSELNIEFPKGHFPWIGQSPSFIRDYKKYGGEPDCYLFRGDTGFQEDIGFIYYYFGFDFFSINKDDKKQWLDTYISTRSKAERSKLLRAIHYKTLFDAKVAPVAAAPYSAVVRKPWQMSLSKFHANNPIWRIHR